MTAEEFKWAMFPIMGIYLLAKGFDRDNWAFRIVGVLMVLIGAMK